MDHEQKKVNPYDMNSASFDSDKYLQNLLKVSQIEKKIVKF